MFTSEFASETDRYKTPAEPAAPAHAAARATDAPEQNLLWHSLAMRPASVASPANLKDLSYGPASFGGSVQAMPQVQAYPGQIPAVGVPLAPPLGPKEQARSDAIAAVEQTIERLHAAISARDGIGIVPHDVDEALCRFFPGFGPDFLEDILARIQPMSGWIPNIEVRKIPVPVPAKTPDGALITRGLKAGFISRWCHTFVRREVPIMDPGPDYVAVFYPDWYTDVEFQATRLLHEFFHYLFVGMKHNPPLNDAFSWGGFASQVGGLKAGPDLNNRYPPCK